MHIFRAETHREAGARLALAVGGKFGFGRFSGQPILVPSAVHVLPRPAEIPLAGSQASVAPQRNNLKCCPLNNKYTLGMRCTEITLHYFIKAALPAAVPNRLLSSWEQGCLYKTGRMHLGLKQTGSSYTCQHILCYFSTFNSSVDSLMTHRNSIKWTSKGEKLLPDCGLMLIHPEETHKAQ